MSLSCEKEHREISWLSFSCISFFFPLASRSELQKEEDQNLQPQRSFQLYIFFNNVLDLKIKFLSSFLSPHLINFPRDVFQKKIPSCRESPEPLLPLQTQRCDTFRGMQCILNSIRINHAMHNNSKWGCQEFKAQSESWKSSISLHSGFAPNCPSYLQSLRIKSSGRLVIALGKSSFSMPLRIKLYVIIWSAPENGGLEKEINTAKWNIWQE